jgi:ATP-binding cassette subfamily B protein
MKNKQQKLNTLTALKNFLPIVFKEAPLLFFAYVLCSVCLGLFWAANTMFMQRFFDSATAIVENPHLFSGAVQALIIIATISCMNQIMNFANNLVTQAYVGKVTGRLSLKIHKKISRLSPICFEDTDTLDCINKAEQGKNNAVWFVLTFFIIICYYIPYFTFMSFYLFTLKPILSVAIFIVFIPTFLAQLIRTKIFSKLEDESVPIRRKNSYFESCIVGREYFKETRKLGAFAYFKKLYNETLILANKIKMKADIRTNIFELFMKILTIIGYCLILFGLFVFLLNGDISVGAFAAVFNSISALFSIMDEVICGHIGNISQNFGTIHNFLLFLELEERNGSETNIKKDSGIILDNVTFRYPTATKNAINNITFSIRNGETIAIVGENGSGKTTLIRLICGLYLPEQGNVKIGGVDTNSATMNYLFENTSAVFQSFNKYQMVLKDNITISETTSSVKETALDIVMNKSGLDDMSIFPDGFNTMLSKEFDGIDLSGGEWQKVAIARGLYRTHDIIILDEPTAAIDPIEESNIYNRFAEIAKNKTAIIVTHRLGSVKLADRIMVLNKGELVEAGTHRELLSLGGHYARMFKEQEHWYK